jgi:hypothetical protein
MMLSPTVVATLHTGTRAKVTPQNTACTEHGARQEQRFCAWQRKERVKATHLREIQARNMQANEKQSVFQPCSAELAERPGGESAWPWCANAMPTPGGFAAGS